MNKPKTPANRCAWVRPENSLYEQYHDKEWGTPVHEDRIHYEFLVLEGAQAGLNWDIILKRRDAYARAFANFDWKKVAKFTQANIEKLLVSSNIIRNRAKVKSAVNNARCFEDVRKEYGSFDAYVWQFVGREPLQPRKQPGCDTPASMKEAKILSDDLKRRGFSFVGPTIVHAYMQATGLINDHSRNCFRFKELLRR